MVRVIIECNRQSKRLYISIRISDRGYTSSIQKARTSPIFIVSRAVINNTVCHALGKYLFVHAQKCVYRNWQIHWPFVNPTKIYFWMIKYTRVIDIGIRARVHWKEIYFENWNWLLNSKILILLLFPFISLIIANFFAK